jgi:hypothetical protein
MRLGQAAVDCAALSSIVPRKGAGGLGKERPSIVVVAFGDETGPVACANDACGAKNESTIIARAIKR